MVTRASGLPIHLNKSVTGNSFKKESPLYLFCFPGRDFAVTSGNHDWEFTFLEENGCIKVKCTRETTTHWLWNVAQECWSQSVDYARDFTFQYLTLRPYVKDPTLTAGVRCPACRELNSSSARYCDRCGNSLNWNQHDVLDRDDKEKQAREYKHLIGFGRGDSHQITDMGEKKILIPRQDSDVIRADYHIFQFLLLIYTYCEILTKKLFRKFSYANEF